MYFGGVLSPRADLFLVLRPRDDDRDDLEVVLLVDLLVLELFLRITFALDLAFDLLLLDRVFCWSFYQ